jgi:DNA invertase Pin-like site-specific DNA recombinase
MDKIKKVVAYYRYSSSKKAQVRNSEERQEDECLEYCNNFGCEIVHSYIDNAISGDDTKPQLHAMRDAFMSGEIIANAVIVGDWSRLTRKGIWEWTEDVKWMKDLGLTLILARDYRTFDLSKDRDNQEFFYMVQQANQFLKKLSKDVIGGERALFRRGELGYARAPFGYDKGENKTLVPNDELPLVKEIFSHYHSTHSIVSCIPIMRKAKRYQNSGKAPSTSAVKTVLRNSIYVGVRTFGVAGTGKHGQLKGYKTKGSRNVNRIAEAAEIIDVSDTIPPVVDRKIFDDVQIRLDSNKESFSQPEHRRKHKWSGLMRCECGAKLVYDRKTKSGMNFVCPKSKNKEMGCEPVAGRKTLNDSQIESYAKLFCQHALRNRLFHTAVLHRLVEYINKAMCLSGGTDVHIMQEIEDYRARRNHVQKMYSDLSMDTQQLDASIRAIDNEISKRESSLTNGDVDVYKLLQGEFLEPVAKNKLSTMPQYLNYMMDMAKKIVTKEQEDESYIPDEYAKTQPDRILKKHRLMSQFRKMLKECVFGMEYELSDLIDEIEVEWKHDGRRCVPKRLIASWKVTHYTSYIGDDRRPQDASGRSFDGFSQSGGQSLIIGDSDSSDAGRRQARKNWEKNNPKRMRGTNTMHVRVVIYPHSNRYYFQLWEGE